MSAPGLITIASKHSVQATIDRLLTELDAHGVTVFARIDHAGGAVRAGMQLRPVELLIFGSPKAGTPLMQAAATIGIDLPLKALAWEDEHARVWLSCNDPAWLAERHGMEASAAAGLKTTLLGFVERAAGVK